MGRISLALAAFAVCFLSAARAADLAPVAAPTPPPASTAPPIWSGLYIGIDGGWADGTGNQIAGVGSVTFGNPFSTGGGMPGTVAGMTTNGGLVGGHIGYNYQVSNLVVGLEASAAWASISGTTTMGLTFPNGAVSTATWSTKVNWQATATPRVGFAYGNWLAYAKGGLAAAGDQVSVADLTGTSAFSATQQRVGYTVGTGFEWTPNGSWVFGIEYDYLNFGSNQNYAGFALLNNAPAGFGATSRFFSENVDLNYSEVLRRASYKW
jgi:outer membrane immunogenic protein